MQKKINEELYKKDDNNKKLKKELEDLQAKYVQVK